MKDCNLFAEKAKKRIHPMTYSYKELRTMQTWPLKDKILWSNQLILREIKNSDKPYVACSFGKDSMVMLHLIRKWCKKIAVVFANTGVEYPETLKYRDFILKAWNIKNYFETKPVKTFWQCVEEYGYPKLRSKDHNPKCCWYCKESPMTNLEKEQGFDVVFQGLQASESHMRFKHIASYGPAYKPKTKIRVVLPLAIWTDSDIFQYIKKNNIQLCDIYKKTSRNGCLPCSGFKGWQKVMAKTYPKMLKKIMVDMGYKQLTEFFK